VSVTDTRERSCRAWLVIAGLLSCAGCSQPAPPSANGGAALPPAATNEPLIGAVTVGGSTTVLPLSRLIVDAFATAHPGVQVTLDGAPTAIGFSRLCAGQLDIAGASRPINAAENAACIANRVEFIELPIAFDTLSVIVNPHNTFAACLTAAELRRLWEPVAQGRVTRWNQVRSDFPNLPIALYALGADSGTFDYFTTAIVGTAGRARRDYMQQSNETELADAVAADPNGLSFFGAAYHAANKDRVKLVSVDGGSGCVTPSVEAVTAERYQPLTRPIFVYVNRAASTRPPVQALARAYVSPESAPYALQAGYVPLPIAPLLYIARRLDREQTGSMFGNRGSVVGVTAELLMDEEKIRNALVR